MVYALNGMISHRTASFELKLTAFNVTVDELEIYMAPPWKQKSMWWLLVPSIVGGVGGGEGKHRSVCAS